MLLLRLLNWDHLAAPTRTFREEEADQGGKMTELRSQEQTAGASGLHQSEGPS